MHVELNESNLKKEKLKFIRRNFPESIADGMICSQGLGNISDPVWPFVPVAGRA